MDWSLSLCPTMSSLDCSKQLDRFIRLQPDRGPGKIEPWDTIIWFCWPIFMCCCIVLCYSEICLFHLFTPSPRLSVRPSQIKPQTPLTRFWRGIYHNCRGTITARVQCDMFVTGWPGGGGLQRSMVTTCCLLPCVFGVVEAMSWFCWYTTLESSQGKDVTFEVTK